MYIFEVDFDNGLATFAFVKNLLLCDIEYNFFFKDYRDNVSFEISSLIINNQIVDDFFKIPREEDL